VNSRRKGKAGELELAAWLRERGVGARRGCQFSGGSESPDVVADLPGVHFEVKRCEALRLWDAVEQAVTDAGERLPVVAHRANRREWVAIVPLDRLLPLLQERADTGGALPPVARSGCDSGRRPVEALSAAGDSALSSRAS